MFKNLHLFGVEFLRFILFDWVIFCFFLSLVTWCFYLHQIRYFGVGFVQDFIIIKSTKRFGGISHILWGWFWDASEGPWDIPRAIKLPGFIRHVKLHGKYYWRDDKSSQVILYGWFTNTDILKLCGIRIDMICPDKNVVNYNSSYHISVT